MDRANAWGAKPGGTVGRYELLERIGRGGMAEVFRARLTGPSGFEKVVVLKRILPSQAEDANAVRMFVEEAKLAAAADHPNIAQVLDLGQGDDGRWYIALEHVAGIDLAELLRAATARNLRVPVWLSLHAYAEVLEGLSFLHELRDPRGRRLEVVHRDVTPSNVLLSRLGQVKLADFGVAHFVGKTSRTEVGQLKGKLGYMSPEQLESRPLDARADLYAVGVGLWECLAQRPLFEGPDPEVMLAICEQRRPRLAEIVTDVPPELDQLVHRAIAIDREQRFRSAAELQSALLDVLDGLRPGLRRADVRRMLAQLLSSPIEDSETSAAAPSVSLPVAALIEDDDATDAMPEALRTSLPAVRIEDSVTTSAPRVSLFVRASGAGPAVELDYGPALTRLEALAAEGVDAAVSADGRRFLPVAELSRLVGIDWVSSSADAPSNVTVVGSTADCSLVAALAILARERHTGTLAVARTGPVTGEWYELDLADGRPTRVATNVSELQLPAVLSAAGLVPPSRVPALVAAALREGRPLEALVAAELGGALDRAALAAARMGAMFQWIGADYAFSVDHQPRRRAPLARSPLGLALRAAEAALGAERLLLLLGARARQRLSSGAASAELLAALELEPRRGALAERLLERLRAGHTVGELADAEPAAAKSTLALAWVLCEAGALVEA